METRPGAAKGRRKQSLGSAHNKTSAMTKPRFKIGGAALVRKFAIHEAAGRRVVLKGIVCSSAQKRPRALNTLPSGPIYIAELAFPDGESRITIVSEAHLEFETCLNMESAPG